LYTNTTIAFSGYNIKSIVLLAIESFLKMYPSMKSQIIFFDDFSTDGTAAALKLRGIKVITWDNSLLEKYNQYVKDNPHWSNVQTLSVRVSFILENIIRQTPTDYLLLNDGDVIFKNNNFLERFFQLSKEADIIYQQDHLHNMEGAQKELFNKIKDKYKLLILKEEDKNYVTWRMFHCHIFMNIKKLKEFNITSDMLDNETVQLLEGGIFDTFSDFTFRAISSPNLKTKNENILHQNILHFGSIACEQRGFVLGINQTETPDGGKEISAHTHRINRGQKIEKDFVVIDFNENIKDLLNCEFTEIEHILFNGYTIKEVHENPKRKMFKLIFKKIL